MIVIPMAGLSRRFREAGYTVPKYMLDLRGETLFAHSVSSFRALFDTEPFLFIARTEADTESFIAQEVARLGVRRHQTVMLGDPTRGQADTVRIGLEQAAVDPSTPLTIFNIDTFRPGFAMPREPWADSADGWLEVMRSTDPGFSFVRPAPEGDGRVVETAEKVVISDLASTGVYGFRKAELFLSALGETSEARGELYIAPMYNALMARGLDVRFREVEAREVVFCGTPSELEELRRSAEGGSDDRAVLDYVRGAG